MCPRVLLVVCGLLSLSACKLENPISGANNPLTAGALKVEMVDFQRSGGPQCPGTPGVTPETQNCATIKVSYPKVLDAGSPEAIDALNQFIQGQLLDYGDENGKKPASLDELANMFIGDYLQDPNPLGNWEMDRTATVSFSAEHLVTLNFSEHGYTGGAHGFSGQRYFVLDTNNGQQLTLGDLLNPGYEGELNVAGERAFRQVRDIPPDASLESAGFWFENNTFSVNNNFGVMEDGLVFAFNPYEVAPYALGPTEFTVPYDDIGSLIGADSPLAGIAK